VKQTANVGEGGGGTDVGEGGVVDGSGADAGEGGVADAGEAQQTARTPLQLGQRRHDARPRRRRANPAQNYRVRCPYRAIFSGGHRAT